MLLGVDTSTPATAVALCDGLDRPVEIELRDDPGPGERPRHAERLQPLMEEALERAGATWDDVVRLCVGVGPGGFTGLRLGIATVRALAQSLDLPIAGVSSLFALARGAEGLAPDGGPVLALIDARRGEVYAGLYHRQRTLMEPQAIDPAALAGSGAVLAVGDGAVRFRAELERAGVAVPADESVAHRVSALMVCRLGRAMWPADRDALLPDYRREPDAVPPKPQ